ncbi:MAG: NAD(P)H-hydrate dehydratase [Gemmatimonadaceae bacterium]
MGVRVATAKETEGCERAAIERGTNAATLMNRAGVAAATLIVDRCRLPESGVTVFAGPGNNGGDGWVVAGALRHRGIECRVIPHGDLRSAEARQARESALACGVVESATAADKSLAVDALLGTGSTGAPRGRIAEGIGQISALQSAGASVVSLDLPSGLDATAGWHEQAVSADLTVSFGNIKRGHLLARDTCGSIAVVDIGLSDDDAAGLPLLVDEFWVAARVPPIQASAHKGTRKTVAVIGGGKGMAGAAILAGEGALRAGAGLLRIVTAPGNEIAVHAGIPAAIVHPWPEIPSELEKLLTEADAIAIGPGLGNSPLTRDLVERVLLAWSGPVVVDADALNVFAGDSLSLAQLLRGRPAVITPHPAELARLLGLDTPEVVESRFDIGLDLAADLGAAVLLKGSPTVIFSPLGNRYVSAAGTAALATGGSGDVLTGMTGTLLAQVSGDGSGADPAEVATCAAFVHGRAAEICGHVRGVTLADILSAMPAAWSLRPRQTDKGVLAWLESFS